MVNLKKSTLFKFLDKTNLGVNIFKNSISVFFWKKYDVIIKKKKIYLGYIVGIQK